MRLTLALLGPYLVELDGKLVESRAKKIEALLVYLILEARQPLPRYVLDGLLFPDAPEESARTNLRQTLSRLRRALQNETVPLPFLKLARRTIQFNTDSDFSLDIDRFLVLSCGCKEHRPEANNQCLNCIEALKEAVLLYRGPFLNGFYLPDNEKFENWLEAKRHQYKQKYLEILGVLAQHFEHGGEYSLADKYLTKQLEIEPWQEEYHQLRMRLLARQGKRSKALAQYNICKKALAEELGVEPTESTNKLLVQIRQATDTRSHKLPACHTRPFVGRTNETAKIQQCLNSPDQRLVTLVGPGGIGKTQLALQVGWTIVSNYLGPFTDGVFLIELEENQFNDEKITVDSIATTIAKVLSIPLSGISPPQPQLLKALKDKECLLLFDNGEYLSNAGKSFITELLAKTKGVKLLIATRERLNLSSEWVLPVEGLPYPNRASSKLPAQNVLPINAVDFEAVDLLVKRAAQVNDQFNWSKLPLNEKIAIVQITQLTEGMPLSLELAATWVRVLSCQQIATEISSTIDILHTTQSDIPMRHRSIYAVFDASWRMLTEAEQKALKQCSVFYESFNLQAAKSVIGTGPALLSQLIDKSLLTFIEVEAGSFRYKMHPLLKQFTYKKLSEGERQALQNCHAEYFGHFVDSNEPKLNGATQSATLKKFLLDLENIQGGWYWAVDQKKLGLFRNYSKGLHNFYTVQGWSFAAVPLFRNAYKLCQEFQSFNELSELERSAIGLVTSRFGQLNQSIGQLDYAFSLIEKSIEIFNRAEDEIEIGYAHRLLGWAAHKKGANKLALYHLDLSFQIANQLQDLDKIAHTSMAIGAVLLAQDECDQAVQVLSSSVLYYRQLEDQWGLGHALRNLAKAQVNANEIGQAQNNLTEAFAIFQNIDNSLGLACVQHQAGQIKHLKKEFAAAEKSYLESCTRLIKLNDLHYLSMVYFDLAKLKIDQGTPAEAKSFLFKSYESSIQVENLSIVLQTLIEIGRLTISLQNTDAFQDTAMLLAIARDHPKSTHQVNQKAKGLIAEIGAETPRDVQKPLVEVGNIVKRILCGRAV